MRQKEAAAQFRRQVCRKLYKLASCKEFVFHDGPEEGHWMRRKVASVATRLHTAVSNLESAILLILGRPGSGKSYLVSAALSEVTKTFGKGAITKQSSQGNGNSGTNYEWHVQTITLETYNHRDELRCLRHLMTVIERMVGVNATRGGVLSIQEMQERVVHCLRLLKESRIYLIIVIEGVDVLTKGRNDCSESTGSHERRQGLLYFLGNLIGSLEVVLSLICVTPDVRTTERLEKRVRSRFMHESVHCEGTETIEQVIKDGNLSVMGPDVEIAVNEDAKALLGEELVCGTSVTRLVAATCAQLPDDAIEELGDGRVRLSPGALSSALRDTKGINWAELVIRQLGLPEHYVLVALTRLHCHGTNPITLIDVEADLQEMTQYFPRERQTIPQFQGLQRVFLRLIGLGLVEWVNLEHNWVGCSEPRSIVSDLHGTNAPCRFPQYRMYLKMDHGDQLPTHLTAWLQLAKQGLPTDISEVWNPTPQEASKEGYFYRNDKKPWEYLGYNHTRPVVSMKVVTKGEPVATEDALVCIRRYLAEHRKRTEDTNSMDEDNSGTIPKVVENTKTTPLSPEAEEWHRRVERLRAFSVDKPSTSQTEENRIRFLEAVEDYIVSTSQLS
ncbi:origin recognition complex subunit, putative [Babesia ovis]|uniref:Origin recognition complex subunit, putative n=1 Tax=Babesia ovis TaxID=5869 RepID=A0A9W5T8K1_BABOV|nr:origin recognition complex subunit, putative [Babesia ovis]